MFLRIRIILVCLALLGAALLSTQVLGWAARAAQPAQGALVTPTPLRVAPEIERPDIGFIDSPDTACTVVRPNTGLCEISWLYMYANASPNYMITMTVEIDGDRRASYHGFFQTYIFVPAEMLVFQVPCGAPGASGNPAWGLTHSYTLRGRDSANLKAANYGSVSCPADEPRRVFLPMMKK